MTRILIASIWGMERLQSTRYKKFAPTFRLGCVRLGAEYTYIMSNNAKKNANKKPPNFRLDEQLGVENFWLPGLDSNQ